MKGHFYFLWKKMDNFGKSWESSEQNGQFWKIYIEESLYLVKLYHLVFCFVVVLIVGGSQNFSPQCDYQYNSGIWDHDRSTTFSSVPLSY
jgi:hypothetical protein